MVSSLMALHLQSFSSRPLFLSAPSSLCYRNSDSGSTERTSHTSSDKQNISPSNLRPLTLGHGLEMLQRDLMSLEDFRRDVIRQAPAVIVQQDAAANDALFRPGYSCATKFSRSARVGPEKPGGPQRGENVPWTPLTLGSLPGCGLWMSSIVTPL
jgi:hypothetical protein